MKKERETFAERQERLAHIRRQVAAGTYETPERLSAAVDRLLANLSVRSDSTDRPPRRPK